MTTSGLGRSNPLNAAETTERRVIANSFVRFTVGQRPKPGANDFHAIDGFGVAKAVQSRAPILGHNAGRMVGKSGEHSHVMPHPRPMPG